MLFEKRLEISQEGELLWMKMTKKQLIAHFDDDVDYAADVILDCKKSGRMTLDRLWPKDESKIRYWVLKDETFKMKRALVDRITLKGSTDLAIEDAKEMMTHGDSAFQTNGDMQMIGMDTSDMMSEFQQGKYSGKAGKKAIGQGKRGPASGLPGQPAPAVAPGAPLPALPAAPTPDAGGLPDSQGTGAVDPGNVVEVHVIFYLRSIKKY